MESSKLELSIQRTWTVSNSRTVSLSNLPNDEKDVKEFKIKAKIRKKEINLINN